MEYENPRNGFLVFLLKSSENTETLCEDQNKYVFSVGSDF